MAISKSRESVVVWTEKLCHCAPFNASFMYNTLGQAVEPNQTFGGKNENSRHLEAVLVNQSTKFWIDQAARGKVIIKTPSKMTLYLSYLKFERPQKIAIMYIYV